LAWWSFFAETDFLAAIAGSIVGGGIAYVMQKSAAREENRRRASDRKEAQQALGHSLLIKTTRIQNNILLIQKYITNSFQDAAKIGYGGRPCQIVKPLASVPPHIDFTPDELSLVMSLKDDELFNRLSQLDGIYNNFIDILTTFNARKAALNEALPGIVVKDTVFSDPLPHTVRVKVDPLMYEVDELIRYLQSRAKVDSADAEKAVRGLVQALNQHLDLRVAVQQKAALHNVLH
jgi:hypothetical protein